MRIAFLLFKDVRRADGPLRKIVRQIQLWTSAGHEVRLFALGPGDRIWDGAAEVSHRLYPYGGQVARLRRARRLAADVLTWRPDLAFFRFAAYLPPLGRLARRLPVVLDLNSNDLTENRQVLSPPLFLYHRLTRGVLLRRAAGLTPVSHELAAFYGRYGKPAAVVSNGIELDRITPLPPAAGEAPRLFFIGSTFQGRPQPWHGVDLVVRLARCRPDWRFEVVGPTPEQLAAATPANLTAHGFLPPDDYRRLLASSDVAIGSLALHRISMREASPLKVREYLASGVATIVGYRDTDFDPPPDFVLRLPGSEDGVEHSLPEIERFVERWRGRRIERRRVRHLDMTVKEEARLEFFQRVVAG